MPEKCQKLAPIAALLLLCLLWAIGTLRLDLLPERTTAIELSPLLREALLLALFAVLTTLTASIRKIDWPRSRNLAEAIMAGLGLFVLPFLLTEFAKARIADSTRVALFSLTPMFAVVLEPYIGSRTASGLRGGFAATMAVLAGTMLVFPLEIPRSAASFIAFSGVVVSAASIAAANCLAVRTCQSGGVPVLTFSAAATGVAAFCLGGLGMVFGRGEFAAEPFDALAVLDLLTFALLFWLMPRMSAVHMTTRFVIAPLLANLIGLALLRPHVPWKAWLGLFLIVVGSSRLLFTPGELPETNRALLKLD